MSIIDLTQKTNMILYVNSKMNLVNFEYLDNLYDILDYKMKADCFIISCCGDNIFKIPVDLLLYNESEIVYTKPYKNRQVVTIDTVSENLVLDDVMEITDIID